MYTDMYITSFCDCQVDTHRVRFKCDCSNIYRGSTINYTIVLPKPYDNYQSLEILFVQNEDTVLKLSLVDVDWKYSNQEGILTLSSEQSLLFKYGVDCRIYVITNEEGNIQIQNPYTAAVLNPQYLDITVTKE